MENKDNHLPKENQRVVSITDQQPVEKVKPKWGLIIAAIAVGIVAIIIAVSFVTMNSHKPKELAPWGSTKGEFMDMVSVAYGYPSNLGSYDDTEVTVFTGLVTRACDDLKYDREIDFKEMINWSDWERLVATASVLGNCNSQQDKAIAWGLTDKDFEKLPLK